MQDMSIYGAAQQTPQQSWSKDSQPEAAAAAAEEAASLPTLLSEKEEEGKNLVEMIRDAQEKAEAQREAMKMPKSSTRYGDAPLEAYARLARARNRMEVNAASGYARRRLTQFKTALRTDSDNAAKIKAAISQLQKAVNRGEKKKRELNREKLEERRKARSEEAEQRMKQELRRRRAQRMIRESGYLREAEISGRLAAHLTATQVELRQQAQAISSVTAAAMDAAAQQYTTTAAEADAAPAPPAAISVQG